MYQDWLPNEDPPKIQYRGPTWKIVYDQFYVPVADRVRLTLGPKQWKRTMKPALKAMHAQFFPALTNSTLVVVRSARHSKFPECTDCQSLRAAYKAAASDGKATATVVAARYDALVAHATQ